MHLDYSTAMVSADSGPGNAPSFVKCNSAYGDDGAPIAGASASDGTYECARDSLDTRMTGRFLVTLKVHDHAGKYGRNQHDNMAVARKAVLIKDTMDPWINVVGADPTYHQCTRYYLDDYVGQPKHDDANTVATLGQYYDKGALVTDNLDTANAAAGTKVYAKPCWTYPYGNTGTEHCAPAGTTARHHVGSVPGETQVAPAVHADLMGEAVNWGNYNIRYNHNDAAGNPADQQTRQVKVRDTVAPTITLSGNAHLQYRHDETNVQTANHKSSLKENNLEEGAVAKDLCDPHIHKNNGFVCDEDSARNRGGAYTSDVAYNAGTYTTTDAAWDAPFSDASYANRYLPECKLEWSRTDFSLDGYTGASSTLPGAPLGTYIRTYTVQDHVGNQNHIIRTFDIIDDESPIITIMGDASETYEASRDEEYTDKGATCADYVDGELSHAVEVSGEVVNYRVPATYTINYDCQDLSGNKAVQEQRQVTIEDTTCPTITLEGNAFIYVEAGFTYVDEGATATDDLDGDITALITTDGDQVNTANAFYSRRSCKDIKDSWNGKTNAPSLPCGNYWITTQKTGDANAPFQRTEVWCDFDGGRSGTYYFKQNIADPVTPMGAQTGAQTCADVGMVLFQERNCAVAEYAAVMTHLGFSDCDSPSGTQEDYGMLITDVAATDHAVTCYDPLNKKNDFDGSVVTPTTQHDHISGFNAAQTGKSAATNERAETGKYLIKFHVVDKAGNDECTTQVRTVVVRDTLAPVISLHLKTAADQYKLIHTSAAKDKGLGGQENPAGWLGTAGDIVTGSGDSKTGGNPYLKDHTSEPSYMAEEAPTSSTNGWIVGAAASAVTGLALLGYSQRKSTVTTVPV